MTATGTPSTIVVVGATGLVGGALIDRFGERDDRDIEVVAVASQRGAGKRLEFGERRLKVHDLDRYTIPSGALVLLAAPTEVARALKPRLDAARASVIDFSDASPNAPLALPWIGTPPDPAVTTWRAPSALVTHLACCLAPLAALGPLRSVHAHCLQPVSHFGRRAIEELAGQTARLLNVQGVDNKVFPAQIAFNVLPDGADIAPERHDVATLLNLSDDAISISRTTVPVFYGQGLQVVADLDADPDTAALTTALAAAWAENPALRLDSGATLSPVTDGAHGDAIAICPRRLGPAPQGGTRVEFWSVVDNVRFSAAGNGIAISDILIKPSRKSA